MARSLTLLSRWMAVPGTGALVARDHARVYGLLVFRYEKPSLRILYLGAKAAQLLQRRR